MRETLKSDSPKSPSIFKQALTVNRKPFPWLKAFSAGLAASLPVFIGLLVGNLEYGLIAGMGGFAYLYVFNIPYAQRARKIFFAVLGMTLASALGTLAAPYSLAVAVLMGIIGAVGIFIFGALKIKGPSAIFFVLVFAMTTGMPVHPELVWVRAGLVFLGGALSWVLAMLGWFFNPHGPETGVVKNVYTELAGFLDSVGTEKFNEERHRVMSGLREAEETLAAGYIPWRNTDIFNRLVILNDHANALFFYVLENFSATTDKLPPQFGGFIREIAQSLDLKHKNGIPSKKILLSEEMDESVLKLFKAITDADAIKNEPTSKINHELHISIPSLRTIFLGAFDKNSIVFITAVRFGLFTIIAAVIAYQFEFTRPFWVPLSCVAVMSGFTIVATYHRAIQRAIGTILGIMIASLILMAHPNGYIIAVLILLLTFITELFIVKNYGLAALFFTPNALLIAESTSHGNFAFSYFASARIIDILIGSIIGLIGVFFVGRRSASSRVPHLITKTIRSQAQFLLVLFSDQGNGFNARKSKERMKMRTNLSNLKTLYDTAAGEIPVDRKALEYYWPVIFSIDHLAYLLENCSKTGHRPILSDQTLSQLLYVCETMANAADRKLSPSIKNVPEIEGFPSIRNELMTLQKSLQIDERSFI
ncbi:FUSC family protein [Neobacillus piezotolerans]|uniref:FUSC family protein n=1 Tax=Neobacillus piezotolerans TaxID=2259171 RepID=A0A3D8GS37_9BACI|nr:FUSC family protein [Neobacillus piezotolerans]RDU37294.1 FUSC family protein [Neobacillus piezotolerans]